jgi:hypothetical protein
MHCKQGTCKVRNEIETKRNETKRNETKPNETKRNQTKRNETDRNETKRNETKRNDVTFRFVSFRSVSFRFIRFRFVLFDFVSFRSFRLVSFRFYFVSHFTGTQKTSTCTLLHFLKILNKIIARISWQNIKNISIGNFFLHANLFMKKPLNNPYSTNK